jgi:hypothetical protein
MMIGIVNEDIHLKKGDTKNLSKSVFKNRANENRRISTPKTPLSIDEHEERNIKNFINYDNFDTNLQYELNSIISNIPQNKSENADENEQVPSQYTSVII